MQQHTGQHLLSAVFIALYNAPTVSFHMSDESCTIDLDVKSLTPEQIRQTERRSNEIIADNVPVDIKFATIEEARQMGVRKIPPDLKDTLRLIEIRGHDLTACGGTHVSRTGEIGSILLRKYEKVKQGVRVEFVCGARAVSTARQDFETLTSAASLFSSHIYDVPEQIRKTLDQSKTAGKREQKTLAELAEFMAAHIAAETPEMSGIRLVKRTFSDRDLNFVKLLAQKLATYPNVVALLASTMAQPALVFAQSTPGRFDMGILMKEAMASLGGRGGGAHDFAQGGAPAGADVEAILESVAAKMSGVSANLKLEI
jgi:alanyl-tRNA synthetase